MHRIFRRSSGKQRKQKNEGKYYQLYAKRNRTVLKNQKGIFRETEEDLCLYTKCSHAEKSLTERKLTEKNLAEKDLVESGLSYVEQPLTEWTGEQMKKRRSLLFIGACGIVVRAIAPFLTDKLNDVPVLVMDEQ